MAAKAMEAVKVYLIERAGVLKQRRREQAALLLKDLEVDLADRVAEIAEDERRAHGLIDMDTGQARLFAEEGRRSGGFQSRRAVAQAQAENRRKEIAEFERVGKPDPPRPLGALFLVPEGVS